MQCLLNSTEIALLGTKRKTTHNTGKTVIQIRAFKAKKYKNVLISTKKKGAPVRQADLDSVKIFERVLNTYTYKRFFNYEEVDFKYILTTNYSHQRLGSKTLRIRIAYKLSHCTFLVILHKTRPYVSFYQNVLCDLR